jgi:uncharacterized phiE125 gp8 family phage protein
MEFAITVQPTVEPLTADDLRTHLRDEFADTDLLESLITAAREYAEQETGRAFLEQTIEVTLDGFPADKDYIQLPRTNLISVTSIVYVDEDGVTQTLSSGDYSADTTSVPSRIILGYDKSWPSTRCQRKAVTITCVMGFGDEAADVPESLKAAMRLLIGDLWENREGKIVGTIQSDNPTVELLLWKHKVVLA